MREEKLVATLTIHGAPDFTEKGKSEVIEWLHKQCDRLYNQNDQLSRRFTAKYLVAIKKKV
jgi:hypothetical protein